MGDIDLDEGISWVSRVVASNHESLRNVKFGCETGVALSYLRKPIVTDMENSLDSAKNIKAKIKLYMPHTPRESILIVESLHLVGIPENLSPEPGAVSLVNIDSLTSLCLESCLNSGQNLSALSFRRSPDAPPLLPQLRSFKIRHEGVDINFQDSLRAFLLNLKGLVHLAVLLEGSDTFLPPDCFVHSHGSTLRTLVWDQRQKLRNRLDESTHTANTSMLSNCLKEIVSKCPLLQELGLAMDARSQRFTVCCSSSYA